MGISHPFPAQADTRRTAELEGLELERVKAAITSVGKQRRLANARQVAAETITQGALVRAKTADEITRSLSAASARDLLSHPDESEVWAADLERVLHHARGAKSPDPRGLTCVVCLCESSGPESNLQPDFYASVCDGFFDARRPAVLREN